MRVAWGPGLVGAINAWYREHRDVVNVLDVLVLLLHVLEAHDDATRLRLDKHLLVPLLELEQAHALVRVRVRVRVRVKG